MCIRDSHRTAASYINYKTKRQQAEENGAYTGEEDFNYAMALCYPKSDLLILDYNRVIKTLCGKEKTEILKELEENFKVENLDGPSKPQIRGEIVMYLEHQWYLLTAKDQSFKFLDVDLIDKHCFQKIFGIKDIRTDERVEFIGGLRNQNELTNLSDNTHGSAFFMFPVKVEDIIATVNQNEIMPCKSTWVEPIPRSGAVVRLIADSNNNNNNNFS
eukprot:TRINITY_DN5511_c0_g2_i1.p1 TRINITY_DN5511_c0_g2~~TRINITY_DN5511_c0_g2_i1.p1  ORF type:complete len:216 (-),score=41.42 TRINITY_DN5511_c0_g2_i1:68-715(-)